MGLPDTDWFIPELYDFLDELGIGRIQANYSRYVIDLNRPLDDEPLYESKTTGLFPDILFDGAPIFNADSLHGSEQREEHHQWCKDTLWVPYHQKIDDELARLHNQFGHAILFDAHSIAARVPMLFEGKLPDFNFGSNEGLACADNMLPALEGVIAQSAYSQVSNGRFKGGYITRSKGRPEEGIHAIQLELSQDTYLQDSVVGKGLHSFKLDPVKLDIIQPLLKKLLRALVDVEPNMT
jgi:formiminoglutamase